MASVTISDIKKSYGSVEVIHGLSLDVEDGQFVVLLGPSGCGKSTLLRMIAGLESVTGGDIMIGKHSVKGVHPKDRNIAMVFQNYALYAHMTVFANMAFSMDLRGVSKAEQKEKVDWAASILNLQDYLKRYPRELSGGQRQRVAMGRAIVRDPAVFLFDEPLSNLDAKLRVQMRTEIKELHQKLKTTTVYVTHDQIEAMTMADLIVIMRDGVIEQQGRPLDVYDNPQNLFVASFIGSPAMNMISGEVASEDGAPVVRNVDGIMLPVPEGVAVTAGQKVVYGVRPEHLAPETTSGMLEATTLVVEPTGPENHIYAALGSLEVCAITRERIEFTPEAPVWLTPDIERVHIFDEASGKVIPRG
ncbi:MAG: sn-glycerol-3-phosphate ABC transporter ATP-binding protein UgpC [Pseudomonadota bacterium]